MVAEGLGAVLVDAAELTGGGFATVRWAALTDGREVAIKRGPPPAARPLASPDPRRHRNPRAGRPVITVRGS